MPKPSKGTLRTSNSPNKKKRFSISKTDRSLIENSLDVPVKGGSMIIEESPVNSSP